MTVKTLTLDGKPVSAREDETILDLCREHKVPLPTLCHLEGLGAVGACRLCLVEVKGSPRLHPACTLRAEEGMEITTGSDRLKRYRRQIVELLFAERNHVCAICVVNGRCELQDVAYAVGLDHVRYQYRHPPTELDASHPRFMLDQGRCVLCTRCVRVCDELEGAHTWDVAGRGAASRVITDLNQPWGKSESCTSCGKCVQVCPTGALFEKIQPAGGTVKRRDFLTYLKTAREKKQWIR
ncbi:MAG: bidirectional hydrogenase complex protein HoxU [Anaeromyxobacter sp.]|nr:bidirectional hydrogenase complex protein HoxU [Anaeromyxobacter sp.]MBL0278483.1 bidirectional hydrogenase complex protein HoxU [Anaeromyxobacter sp.]